MTLEYLKKTVNDHVPLPVIKHFFIYIIGKILTSAISFISAPIMMILLPTGEYGLLSLIHSFNNVTMSCLGLGLVQLLLSEYNKCTTYSHEILINTIVLIYILCIAPIFIIGSLFFRSTLADFLFIPQNQQSIVYGILLICFFSFFNDLFYQVLQINGQSIVVTVLQVIVAALMVLSNIILIKFFNYDIQAVVWTQCLSVLAIFTLGCIFYLHNRYYNHFSFFLLLPMAPNLLRMSLPLVPFAFVGWTLALVNRWILTASSGLESTGIYSIADAGGQLMYRMIIHPIQGAYGPYIMNAYASDHAKIAVTEKNNYRIMMLVMFFLLVVVIVGYSFTKPLLYYMVPQRYSGAIDCALWILIGYVFLISSYFLSTFIQFRQKQWIFIVVFAITLLVNTALSLFITPLLGLWGLVYIVAITYSLHFALLALFNRLELAKFKTY